MDGHWIKWEILMTFTVNIQEYSVFWNSQIWSLGRGEMCEKVIFNSTAITAFHNFDRYATVICITFSLT